MENRLITRHAVRYALADYWGQYKAYPWRTFFALSLPVAGSILVFFVPPLILARLINIFVEEGAVSLGIARNYIFLYGGLWLLGEFFWRAGLHFLISVEAKGLHNLGKLAFRRLADRDYEFYADNFVGSLTKKALAFSRSFEAFTDTLVFNVITNIFPMIFAVIILWSYSPWLPIVLVGSFVVVIATALPFIRRRSRLVALRHDASSKVAGRLSDVMTNIMAIKSFAKEETELDTYGTYVSDFVGKFKKAADYHNLRFETVVSPLYVATNVLGLIASIVITQRLGLQVGVIVVVFAYFSLTTRIFWDINRVYRNIESSISEAAEFTQLFIDMPVVRDAPRARPLRVAGAHIRFDRVNFAYHGDSTSGDLFLRDFNLHIRGKQKVGLVGPSGGGKTTITKLLLRFVDFQAGSITIDEQNIKGVTQNSLREAIAYVPQEPLLFHRTLYENIAYGNENALENTVVEAATLAHAHEFIAELPRGYQTFVGERGVKLSGGQKQRVAIARAILKNAPILVLDEATSSLDSESEKYIQQGLWELMKKKTALVIAHRLSTIKHLDRIVVLDKGKVVQDGTHDKLVRQRGIYATLWRHQSGGFLEG